MKLVNHDIEVLTTIEELVAPAQTAVIVIDIQNALVRRVSSSDGAYALSKVDVANVNGIIGPIQRLLGKARSTQVPIIYTEFVHRSTHGATLMDGPSTYCVRELNEVADLTEGSWEAQTVEELSPKTGDLVIHKSRGSAMHATILDNYLKIHGIRSLLITGLVTNGCVLMTAVDTMHHGYYPVILSDCVSAYDREWHEIALQWMKTQFPVSSSERVIAAWGVHQARSAGWP